MKYIQNAGGYCYKQYKNGKKVRISKRAYNKQISGMKNQQQKNKPVAKFVPNQQQQNKSVQKCQGKPQFKIGDRVQCNSDICYQKFNKYLIAQGDYINFKPLNLKITKIYCYKQNGNNNLFNQKKVKWAKLLKLKLSALKFSSKNQNNWIIYEVKSDKIIANIEDEVKSDEPDEDEVKSDEPDETIANIEEKSLYKFMDPLKNPLSTKFVFPDVKNEYAIFAHGFECIQEKDDTLSDIHRNELKKRIIKNIYKPVSDIYKKYIKQIIQIINITSDDEELLSNMIEYHIGAILGSSKLFFDDFDDIKNYNIPKLYTIKNTPKDFYNLTDLSDLGQKEEYKKRYNKFYPIFITEMLDGGKFISSSPTPKGSYNGPEQINYLDLYKLIDKILESYWFKSRDNFYFYFYDFMKNVKDKVVNVEKFKKIYDIYKTSLSQFENKKFIFFKKSQFEYLEKKKKNKGKIVSLNANEHLGMLYDNYHSEMILLMNKLKKMLTSYGRSSHNKVIKDIILYDNQYVIMKCDAGCTLWRSNKNMAETLIDKEVKGVKDLMYKYKSAKLEEYCIFENMAPNILLTFFENEGIPDYNYHGVFKLPLRFKQEEPRRISDPEYQSPWQININGLKQKDEEGKLLHYFTNLKSSSPDFKQKEFYNNLERIIKNIRKENGKKTSFIILLDSCRSGVCLDVKSVKYNYKMDGGQKNKKKVKKGGLKKKVKGKKITTQKAKKVRKSKKN
jgi:hypothetical protein